MSIELKLPQATCGPIYSRTAIPLGHSQGSDALEVEVVTLSVWPETLRVFSY